MHRQGHGKRVVGRRRFIGLMGGVSVTLAGCLGGDGAGGTNTTGSATESEVTTRDLARETTRATSENLDLREANVLDVAVEPTGGSYRFSVTLYHDDDGEAGYANWWQVETLDGEQLGRRELRHPHGTTRFTRSEVVEIPSGTDRVVVRGHDETHGYGGRAMVVTLETGATEFVEHGSEPRSFDESKTSETTNG